jgi:subtilisin family serine protease
VLPSLRRAVQYALRKGVDVIVPSGNENQNLDDPKTDSISPTNGTAIQDRPVDLVR